jgi:hypothetical protein
VNTTVLRAVNDHLHGLEGRAIHPYERDGGGISTGGRINIDSGLLNPDQISEQYGKKAGKLRAKSRLRDREDALIAHRGGGMADGAP